MSVHWGLVISMIHYKYRTRYKCENTYNELGLTVFVISKNMLKAL